MQAVAATSTAAAKNVVNRCVMTRLDYACLARVSTWCDCRFPHAPKLAECRVDEGRGTVGVWSFFTLYGRLAGIPLEDL